MVCLPDGKYTFTVMDQNKDGMCCNHGEGKYVLTYQSSGEMIATGGSFEESESTTFNIPYESPGYQDSDWDGVEDRTGNIVPPMLLNADGVQSCENEFGLHLRTDDYGVETMWELRERSQTEDFDDGRVVVSGGPYTSNHTYDLSYCLEPGKYTFVFYDWQCDGLRGETMDGYYTLKVNGYEVHTGGTNMTEYAETVKLEFTNPLSKNNGALTRGVDGKNRGVALSREWWRSGWLGVAGVVIIVAL